MTRISKRTREQAALICAVCASQPSETFWTTYTVAVWLSAEALAADLATMAWERALPGVLEDDWRHTYARAEALLRTGWVP